MGYRVVKSFVDPRDGKPYRRGADYTATDEGHTAMLVRIGVLDTSSDLGAKGDLPEGVKSLGGGWYKLPSGEHVQGKQAALDAMDSGEGDA